MKTPAEDIAFLRSLVPNIHINETAREYAAALNRLEQALKDKPREAA